MCHMILCVAEYFTRRVTRAEDRSNATPVELSQQSWVKLFLACPAFEASGGVVVFSCWDPRPVRLYDQVDAKTTQCYICN